MNDKRFQSSDGTIYWEYGNPKGPVIVMIHGFRGTHHGLEYIASYLDDYRIIIPDLPGFGATKPMNNDHSIDDFSNWLDSFIKSFGFKMPPLLFGHSFGSIVSARFAKEHPNKILALVLVNPIAKSAASRPTISMTKIGLIYSNIGFKLPSRLAHAWHSAKLPTIIMTLSNARTRDRQLRRLIHQQHLKHFSTFTDIESLQKTTRTSIFNSVLNFATDIKVKTLLIIGDKDIISTVKEQNNLHQQFPDASLKTIKNVGHLTHYETPDQVADLVREFIKSI